ncbi:(Fe-S)-binding protein [Methanohalobium sp.]|uniref:(Fe-S)-binding protein n=1 Tax=Methanohalobium sp. TaxID=2837493 RepID=UPI0025D2BCA0|nr:(Fe-S)-binding protein [Methanohalobium sp.]
MEFDNIYLSTRCGACDDVCPVNIPIKDIIQYERHLLAEQDKEPEKTKGIVNNILVHNNPGGKDNSKRFDWITDDLKLSDDSEIVYMAGCWISYAQPEIARSTIRVLNSAGIEPRILNDDKCCRIFLVDNGHFDEMKTHAKNFVDYIESLGIKKLIVSYPGCYKTLNGSYPQLYRELSFEVVPSIELFDLLIKESKLQTNDLNLSVALKDSCHLKNNIDTPRNILNNMGVKVIEIFDRDVVCCGAPAGLKPNFPETSSNIAGLSLRKSNDVSDLMVAYCPFCIYHMNSANNYNLQIKDISQLLEDSIQKNK